MSISFFIEKDHQPTEAEIRLVIGPGFALWEALLGSICSRYPAQEDLKYMYGKTYGWAWRFRMKGQQLVCLYPTQGGFTAQVIPSPAAIEKAQALKPGENVTGVIERATPYRREAGCSSLSKLTMMSGILGDCWH